MVMVYGQRGKAYREQQRARWKKLGLEGHHLIEQVALDLMRGGDRPRKAWRLAHEFTQPQVATRFDQIRAEQGMQIRGEQGMRASRISEHESWPGEGGIKPSVRTLRILAQAYGTTWDRLVDLDDLEKMIPRERQAYLDAVHLRCRDSLDLSIPQQRHLSAHEGVDNSEISRRGARGDSMSVRHRGGSRSSSSGPVGSGLPGDVTYFTGRDAPLAELRDRIAKNAPQGTVVSIYAIDGMPGVGKTAFARHAAQELCAHYPDGAIWVDLYGYTPGVQAREPDAALEQMLLQLDVPPEAIKADPIGRQDQWRQHISSRRMLIVLDDAQDSEQVLPLLPHVPGCLVLITSRRRLTSLTDAYPLSLDVLSWEEAEELFEALVGAQRCEDRAAVRLILDKCGRLPLAIRIIAGQLRHHRGDLLADVAADLTQRTAALDAFSAENVSVRAAFESSYQRLADEQQRSFRRLGWHPGPEITPVVIAALANVSQSRGRQLLHELVDDNLLEQLPGALPGTPCYRMHDLMREYAKERANSDEPPTEHIAAINRLAKSYVTKTREANRLLRRYACTDPATSTAQTNVQDFADPSQARYWLIGERYNLLGCVQAMGMSSDAAELSIVLAPHFRDFGFWSDLRFLYRQALTTYQHFGNQRGEVEARWGLGQMEWSIGENDQARNHYTQALTLARDIADQRGEIHALCGLGDVEWVIGKYDQADDCYDRALALAQELDYEFGEVEALWGLGEVEWIRGKHGQTREYYTQAATLAHRIGHQRAEVDLLRGLSEVERLGGKYSQARPRCMQALTMAHDLRYQIGEIGALLSLGETERLVGEYSRAREYNTQALTQSQSIGYQRGEADALWCLGQVARLGGEYRPSREHYNQALTVAVRTGYRRVEVKALWGLGQLEWASGEYGRARDYHTKALTLAELLGFRRAEAEALRGLGQIDRCIGDFGQARQLFTQALDLSQLIGYRVGEVSAMRGLGHVERDVANYDQARQHYTQTLDIAKQCGDRRGEFLALCGQGSIERRIGDYSLGRKYYNQAMAVAQQLAERHSEVRVLRALGEVERLAGEYDQACEYYKNALTSARQHGYLLEEVLDMLALGEVEQQLDGEYGQAREYYKKALALAQQHGYRFGEMRVLCALGKVEQLATEYEQASGYYTQLLDLAQHLGNRIAEAKSLYKLGHVTSDTAKRDELLGRALEICETLHHPFAETVRKAMHHDTGG